MSHASSSSSPPIPSLASKPPASRTAERRTIAPQAMNESSGWPGWPGAAGSGLWAISTHVGSSRSPRPTTTWALISPSRASASRSVAAWASAPGAYHESSSASATYGVVAAVRGRVVDQDPLRPLGQGVVVREGGEQPVPTVAGGDHDRHVGRHLRPASSDRGGRTAARRHTDGYDAIVAAGSHDPPAL